MDRKLNVQLIIRNLTTFTSLTTFGNAVKVMIRFVFKEEIAAVVLPQVIVTGVENGEFVTQREVQITVDAKLLLLLKINVALQRVIAQLAYKLAVDGAIIMNVFQAQ